MKKENEQSASQDTSRADIKEKYNQVLQENKKLKSKIEAKSLKEKFNQEQELGEAKREGIRLEAKNMQLENRITQLEKRLTEKNESEQKIRAQIQRTEDLLALEKQKSENNT